MNSCRTTRPASATFVFLWLALAAMVGAASADDYPSRPITIIVPFTAGGPADTAARTISDALRRQVGQSLVIENRTGASGIPGVEAVVNGEGDGYTLLLGGIAPMVLIPPIQKVRYDVEKDLVPLGLIWRSPQVFAVSRQARGEFGRRIRRARESAIRASSPSGRPATAR